MNEIKEKNYTDEDVKKTVTKLLNYFKSIYEPQENPKAILLGGQPGAGKSALENMINIKNEYISISGDDYRKYHPLFDKLNNIYGKSASEHTQQWIGEITRNLIDNLREEKYNLLIEGTLRTYEHPLKEAINFKKNNYSSISLYVMTVKPEKSYLGTLLRYEKMIEAGQTPRMTPKNHHDYVVENISSNLNILYKEKVFDSIKLYDRNNVLLYDMNLSKDINPKDILENEFKRKWTKNEIQEYEKQWDILFKKMKNRSANKIEKDTLLRDKENILKNISTEKINPFTNKLENEKSRGLGRC